MIRSPLMNRRTLLRGLGATALIAPFAQLANLRRAQAAPPKRAMFVYVPDGCIPDIWHPTGSETSFTLPSMTAPLEAIKQNLVFIDGLTMYSGGATHEGGVAKVLTGVSPKSIDIFLGEQIGTTTPIRSLQLGVGSTFQNGAGSMSFIGDGQPVNPNDDPLNAFSGVFGSTAPGASNGVDPDLAKRQKQSILDAALADLNALEQKLGSTEKEKLDVHLDSLRELERRITNPAVIMGGACNPDGFNQVGFTVSATDYYPKTYHKEENFRKVGELMMDLATLALSCGSTNVVSLMWSHPVSPTHIQETGVTTGEHDASHYGDPSSQNAKDFTTLKRWFMDRFVYLIQKLAATPDTSGTLLDNTLVLLCSELGDSNRHDHDRVPFVLAGGAGGALKTGRFLNYEGKNAGENEPHTKLLVSVANAMGVQIDSYGFTGKGTGPLSGLL
ncbi:MAG TPA: DUF1552 domain-containing protein [Polyangiaceae bacterium]|nr:DUF1552 domain-containing protein [Polyangiaceae bacterium]